MYAQLMKRQKANSLGNITWSELGKQNIKAKKVYFQKVANKSWSFLSQAISGEVRFAPGLLASSIG